jgi:hypothetical protein
MNSDPRAYTFDWRADEHARVTSLLVREQFDTGFRRAMKWGVVIILVLGAFVAVATAIAGSLAEAMPLGALVIAVAALVLAWQLKRTDPNVAHPITHSLDESGYHVSSRTTDVDLKWEGLHKVRETTDLFMFYYSSRLAYYLPKRALPNPEEVAELRAWVRARLPLEVAYVES